MRRAGQSLIRALAARGAAVSCEAAHVTNTGAAAGLLARRAFADDAALLKTPLYDFHVAHGGAHSPPPPPPPTAVYAIAASPPLFRGVCPLLTRCRCTAHPLTRPQARWCPLQASPDVARGGHRRSWGRLELGVPPGAAHPPALPLLLQAGPCPSSTRTASWRARCGAASTRPSLTSPTCAASRSRCAAWRAAVWLLLRCAVRLLRQGMLWQQRAVRGCWCEGGEAEASWSSGRVRAGTRRAHARARPSRAASAPLALLHTHTLPRPAQGKDAIAFLEGLVVGDVAGLADGTGTLSVFTNEKGGIIDDTGALVGWAVTWRHRGARAAGVPCACSGAGRRHGLQLTEGGRRRRDCLPLPPVCPELDAALLRRAALCSGDQGV